MPDPIDTLEEHELILGTPPRDAITVRAVYRHAEGSLVVLPAAVQNASTPPEVFVVGNARDLSVRHGAHGWETTLPSTDQDTIRLVARANVPLEGTRLFTARWPLTAAPAAGPIRRVALVPRNNLSRVPAGWSCTDDASEQIPCVSTERNPQPLSISFRAHPSPRGALPIALAAIVLAAALLVLLGPAPRRTERAVGALAGSVAGSAIALAIVGALWTHWAFALAACALPFVALGAIATRTRRATSLGGLALFSLPLLSVIDGRPWHVMAAAALFALPIAILAFRPGAIPQAPTPQPRESSPAPPPESSPSP